jgi:hypothetical protein
VSIIYNVSETNLKKTIFFLLIYLVRIMNFILDFLGYLFLFQSIVGLKLNGQQKVKPYVHEKDLFIYVY